MPGATIVPPGGLHLHIVLLIVTPALVALAGGIAARAAGTGLAARYLAGVGLGAAIGVQALFLLPGGAAGVVFPGLSPVVRVGWLPDLLALALGCWAAWRWRAAGILAWCSRTALALALPVVLLAPLIAACEPDLAVRHRRWRLLGYVLAALVSLWLPAWSMALAATIGATAAGAWRWPLVLVSASAVVAAWSG
ncbi:MAG: hypothetical protein H0W72_16495 [Planctomycetes bacterium]|nr:hypothetical protein [Planctomycetota bacterium]